MFRINCIFVLTKNNKTFTVKKNYWLTFFHCWYVVQFHSLSITYINKLWKPDLMGTPSWLLSSSQPMGTKLLLW
jgi:hypothetical protein